MIVDAHTHIFPPDVCDFREKYCVPEEVAFSSIYRDPKARLVDAEGMVSMMDEQGVDRAVVFGFPWVSQNAARWHNDYVLDAQARYPDRLTGLACFDPLQPWSVDEAERALAAGLSGLGELALYSYGFNRTAVERFAELGGLCLKYNRALLVHVNEPIGHDYPGKAPMTLKEIYNLIQAVRGVKLILAHWGGGVFFYNLLKKEVPEALSDVYFDTAASPFLYRPEIYAAAARIVGPERILFGSDYPLIKPERYFKEIEASGLGPDQVRMVEGINAARVFDLDGRQD